MVAINPGKRAAQARDAKRKQDINTIANGLIGYYTIIARYPADYGVSGCNTSIGPGVDPASCPPNVDPPGAEWFTLGPIYWELVTQQGFLKRLPIDPKNNLTYYYSYKPRLSDTQPVCFSAFAFCQQYWIGARLEAPQDTAKPIFRCSDFGNLTDGPGCKEVGPDSLLENTNPSN